MKRIVLAAFAAVVSLGVAASVALAGTETGPKIAMHVKASGKSSVYCTTYSPNVDGTPCSNYVVNAALNTDNVVYLVVAQADTAQFATGIGGVTLGIEYNGDAGGVTINEWKACADGLEIRNGGPDGDWPASGGGNVITWLNCPTTELGADGIHGIVGWFSVYAYTKDILRVTPNRNFLGADRLVVADCASQETDLDTTGTGPGPAAWVGFGAASECLGCNPCVETCTSNQVALKCPVPVEPTTWGRLKSMY